MNRLIYYNLGNIQLPMKRLLLLFPILLTLSCASQSVQKINGVSFVASREKAEQVHIEPILKINANYAAVMPFGFISDLNNPEVIHNSERQWFGETKAGGQQYIVQLHANNIKVMVKPQIWIRHGQFTGDLVMNSEADWVILEKGYTDFILTYASLAEETKADIFCIGTELEEFVKHRPDYWFQLIDQIREVYTGKLTYAANWDEYTRTPFWEDLDFIGVDAYFPLSESQYPSKQQMKDGWQKWKKELAALSKEVERPVLFTEFGYRSMDYTAHKPWLVDRNETNVNLKAQSDALQVTFEEFWGQDWFMGGFIWKWFLRHNEVGGEADNRFTPQNKPAEKVIQAFYGRL